MSKRLYFFLAVLAVVCPAASAINCTYQNMSNVTILPGSSGWDVSSGPASFGVIITNETAGNVSFYGCGSEIETPGDMVLETRAPGSPLVVLAALCAAVIGICRSRKT